MVSNSIVFVLVALLGVSAAQYDAIRNNLVEFDVPVPAHLSKGLGLPYPYQEIKPVYGPLVVPAPTAVVTTKLGLVSSIVSHAISFIHSAISFLFINVPAIIIGVLTSLGLCKFTHICTKFSSIQSLEEVQEHFRSFATPERIARAAEFVQDAIKKYGKINEN